MWKTTTLLDLKWVFYSTAKPYVYVKFGYNATLHLWTIEQDGVYFCADLHLLSSSCLPAEINITDRPIYMTMTILFIFLNNVNQHRQNTESLWPQHICFTKTFVLLLQILRIKSIIIMLLFSQSKQEKRWHSWHYNKDNQLKSWSF